MNKGEKGINYSSSKIFAIENGKLETMYEIYNEQGKLTASPTYESDGKYNGQVIHYDEIIKKWISFFVFYLLVF